MSASRYILEPGSQDLSAHSGHKVEVTGTLASAGASPSAGASSSGAGAAGTTAGTSTATGNTAGGAPSGGATATATPPTASGAGATASSMGAGQRIQVASVRMIASTCP
jgi:hypothetical protein